jgi:hypothetical protein
VACAIFVAHQEGHLLGSSFIPGTAPKSMRLADWQWSYGGKDSMVFASTVCTERRDECVKASQPASLKQFLPQSYNCEHVAPLRWWTPSEYFNSVDIFK